MTKPADPSELLNAVLKPLLDDFTYWFGRTKTLLEADQLPTLTQAEQADLLHRVSQADGEVMVAKRLFSSTGGQVGVDMAVVNQWHRLVAECWSVAKAYRQHQSSGSE